MLSDHHDTDQKQRADEKKRALKRNSRRNRTDESLQSVAAEIVVVGRYVYGIPDSLVQPEFPPHLIERLAADDAGTGHGKEAFTGVPVMPVQINRHNGTQNRIAEEFQTLIVQLVAGSIRKGKRTMEQGNPVEVNISRAKPQELIQKKVGFSILAEEEPYF